LGDVRWLAGILVYRVVQKTDTWFFHPLHLYCVTTLPSKTNTVKATVVSENRQHIKISIS